MEDAIKGLEADMIKVKTVLFGNGVQGLTDKVKEISEAIPTPEEKCHGLKAIEKLLIEQKERKRFRTADMALIVTALGVVINLTMSIWKMLEGKP